MPKINVTPGKFSFRDTEVPVILPKDLTSNQTDSWMTSYLADLEAKFEEALANDQWKEARYIKHTRIASVQNMMSYRSSRYSWRTKAPKIQHLTQTLVEALNRRTTVRWFIPKADEQDPTKKQEHSYYDKKLKKWVVALNIQKLKYAHQFSHKEHESPDPHMMQATIGQGIHEIGHTLYSPAEHDQFCKTYEQLVMSAVYEDMYVNARLLDRLPGATPILNDTTVWTNPPQEMRKRINAMLKEAEPEFFEEYASVLGFTDHVAISAMQAQTVNLPNQAFAELYEELRPYVEELTSGDSVEPERRYELYQTMADHITKRYPPALHQKLPDVKHTTNQNGGTETDLSQITQAGKLEDIVEDFKGCATNGHAEGQALSGQDQRDAENLNADADTAEGDNVGGMQGINYNRPHNGRSVNRPNVDNNIVDRIRRIFKTRFTERRNYIHGMPEGKLSTRRVHKLARPTVDKMVFKRRPKLDSVNSVVLFLVDASGSMSGSPYSTAIQAAETMFQAIRLNPDYKTIIWTYSGSAEMVDIMAVNRGKESTVWPALWGGGTPSFAALGKAYEYLHRNYKTSHKIIIHFTDAAPGGDGLNSEWFVRLKKDKSAAYCSIAICDPNQLQHLREYWPDLRLMHETTRNLPKAVQEFIIEHAQ